MTLAAGDILRYTLSGSSTNTTAPGSQNTPLVTSNTLPLIFGGILLIVALLGGGLYLIGSRNRAPAQASDQQVIDVLIRQIAELDADHEAGKIDDDAYTVQRGALKARLAALMERKK